MRLSIVCAFSLALFCGSARGQESFPSSELAGRIQRDIYRAEAQRVAKLEKTVEGRAALQVEAKERAARELANDPRTIARARAYRKNHRAAIAAKKHPVDPAMKQDVAIAKEKAAAAKKAKRLAADAAKAATAE